MPKQPLRTEAKILTDGNPVSVDSLTGEQRLAHARWLRRTVLEARFGSAVRWEEADENQTDRQAAGNHQSL